MIDKKNWCSRLLATWPEFWAIRLSFLDTFAFSLDGLLAHSGGSTPNGKGHLKFPFWLLAHLPYGFFSDEVDDGSVSLNLRGSGDLQFTTLIMSSLMICFTITITKILSFSLACSVQGEHTHFWREREDGKFDSEAGKSWPGWFVKHFKARLILLIWQTFES